MAERSAEDLLDWAFSFLCNAVPMVERAADDGFSYESQQWLDAWEDKFKPAYHKWLDSRPVLPEPEQMLGTATPPQRESLSLDALVLMIKRLLEGTLLTGDRVALIHVDTLRDIYEELARLQDLEK